jgi:hypothetical protein
VLVPPAGGVHDHDLAVEQLRSGRQPGHGEELFGTDVVAGYKHHQMALYTTDMTGGD